MTSLLEQAQEFAQQAHLRQEYGAGSFFERHLRRVVETLEAFGEKRETLLAAAWLHDAVEDTPATIRDIRKCFGEEVADLVWRLTDEAGRSRRERQSRTHAKIRGRPEAVRIKLADRIANVEASIEQSSHLFGMYRAEYRQFRRELYRRGEWEAMWARLDDLLTQGRTPI